MELLRDILEELVYISGGKDVSEDDYRSFERRIKSSTAIDMGLLFNAVATLRTEYAMTDKEVYVSLWACSKDFSFVALATAELGEGLMDKFMFRELVRRGLLDKMQRKSGRGKVVDYLFYRPTIKGREFVRRAFELMHPDYPQKALGRFYKKDMMWVNTYVKKAVRIYHQNYM